jgi:hypothetical protein
MLANDARLRSVFAHAGDEPMSVLQKRMPVGLSTRRKKRAA